jgi:hypothetical protein
MASWIKGTFLDYFMPTESPERTYTRQAKRKAAYEERGGAKARRYTDQEYRNAPYGRVSPPKPKRPEDVADLETIRARRSLQDLKRHMSTDPNPRTLELIDQLEGELYEKQRPTGRLTPSVTEQQLDDDSLPSYDSDVEVLFSDEESVPSWPIEGRPYVVEPTPTPRRTSIQKPVPPKMTKAPVVRRIKTLPKKTDTKPVDEPWARGIETPEMWATRPNKRAREMLKSYPQRARQFIQAEVQEPEYALRDVEIRDGLWHLMDLMERLSKQTCDNSMPSGIFRETIEDRFKEFTPETAKIIGCVASGGPGGAEGWKHLFVNLEKRRALVQAIIGNVLVEQVFQHMFFGGIHRHIIRLGEMQETHKNEDCESLIHFSNFITSN